MLKWRILSILWAALLLPLDTGDAGWKKYRRKNSFTTATPPAFARILESRRLPDGRLEVTVPLEDTYIKGGKRTARVRPYDCYHTVLKRGKVITEHALCVPIVKCRRLSTGAPTETIFSTTHIATTGIFYTRPATTSASSIPTVLTETTSMAMSRSSSVSFPFVPVTSLILTTVNSSLMTTRAMESSSADAVSHTSTRTSTNAELHYTDIPLQISSLTTSPESSELVTKLTEATETATGAMGSPSVQIRDMSTTEEIYRNDTSKQIVAQDGSY